MQNQVKVLREAHGLTQEDLAQAVHVTSRTIISLEKSKYRPSIELAYRLARFFGTDIESLFCLSDNFPE